MTTAIAISETALSTDETELDSDGPIEPGKRAIIWEPQTPSVFDLYRRCKNGRLELRPKFQRYTVWNTQRNSKFIESILLGIPLPYIYLAEVPGHKTVVVDGLQRLSAIVQYMDNEYALQTAAMPEFNGRRWQDLDDNEQERIEARALPVVVIKSSSDQDIKYEVFHRLNTGAQSLNAQEVRNCVNRGPFNDMIVELAEDDAFVKLYSPTRTDHQRMRDVEAVLRFFAFHDGFAQYRNPLKRFLDQAAECYSNREEPEIPPLRTLFRQTVDLCNQVFGETAFRFYTVRADGGAWSRSRNAALQDAVLYAFGTRLNQRQAIIQNADAIREALINLMVNDGDFQANCDQHTSDTLKVQGRIRTWERELDEVLSEARPDTPRRFSRRLKLELLERERTCRICGQHINGPDTAEIDHITPYWKGGATIPENARLSHRYCNRSRAENRRR